jgi:phosphoribosyl-AMP cyclohydrolase
MSRWREQKSAVLEETLSTDQVGSWSRSRRRLWRKGETGGHRQHLSASP